MTPSPDEEEGAPSPPAMFWPGAGRLLKGPFWLLDGPLWLLKGPVWLLKGPVWFIPGPFCTFEFGSELVGTGGLPDGSSDGEEPGAPGAMPGLAWFTPVAPFAAIAAARWRIMAPEGACGLPGFAPGFVLPFALAFRDERYPPNPALLFVPFPELDPPKPPGF